MINHFALWSLCLLPQKKGCEELKRRNWCHTKFHIGASTHNWDSTQFAQGAHIFCQEGASTYSLQCDATSLNKQQNGDFLGVPLQQSLSVSWLSFWSLASHKTEFVGSVMNIVGESHPTDGQYIYIIVESGFDMECAGISLLTICVCTLLVSLKA